MFYPQPRYIRSLAYKTSATNASDTVTLTISADKDTFVF